MLLQQFCASLVKVVLLIYLNYIQSRTRSGASYLHLRHSSLWQQVFLKLYPVCQCYYSRILPYESLYLCQLITGSISFQVIPPTNISDTAFLVPIWILHAQFLPINLLFILFLCPSHQKWFHLVPGGSSLSQEILLLLVVTDCSRWLQLVPAYFRQFQHLPGGFSSFQVVPPRSRSFQLDPRFSIYAV